MLTTAWFVRIPILYSLTHGIHSLKRVWTERIVCYHVMEEDILQELEILRVQRFTISRKNVFDRQMIRGIDFRHDDYCLGAIGNYSSSERCILGVSEPRTAHRAALCMESKHMASGLHNMSPP
jgi:hypothetical protein